MIRNSTHAALWFGSLRVGKVRDINLQIDREALEDTKQGDVDRTYIKGLRTTSAQGTLFYDPEDDAVAAFMGELLDDTTAVSNLTLVFDSEVNINMTGPVIVTSATLSASVGAAQTCQLQFQLSGKPAGSLVPVQPTPPEP